MTNKFNGLPAWAVCSAWSVEFKTRSVTETFELKNIEYAPNNIRAVWSAMCEARVELQHVHARQIALLMCSGYVADYMRELARWTTLEKPAAAEAEYIKIGRDFRERGVDPRALAEHNHKQILHYLAKTGVATIDGEPIAGKEGIRARAVTASHDEARYDKSESCMSIDDDAVAAEQSLSSLLKRLERPTSEKEKRKHEEAAEADGLLDWMDEEEPGETVLIEESPAISRTVIIHSAPEKPLKAGAGDEEARHKVRKALASKKEIGPAHSEHQVDEIASAAYIEAPWHAETLSWIRDRHHEAIQNAEKCTQFPPVMLIGPPGCGKTFLMTRLSELLGLPSVRMDMSASLEPWPIAGGAWGWRNAQPGIAVKTVLETGHANPLILLDEIEKAGQSRDHGGPLNALLPLLQAESAATYRCPYLESEVDLSRVSWIMLGNSLSGIPAPLRDRVTVIEARGPRGSEIRHLAQRLLGDLAADQRVVDAAAHAVESGEMSLRGLYRLARNFAALDQRPTLN